MTDQCTAVTARRRGDRPSQDCLLELLADERRRHVVAHLRGTSVPVAVADLARRVAELETDGDGTPQDHEAAVHAALHHSHVPKLAAAKVVSRDRDRDTVTPGPEFERAAALLDTLAAIEER